MFACFVQAVFKQVNRYSINRPDLIGAVFFTRIFLQLPHRLSLNFAWFCKRSVTKLTVAAAKYCSYTHPMFSKQAAHGSSVNLCALNTLWFCFSHHGDTENLRGTQKTSGSF